MVAIVVVKDRTLSQPQQGRIQPVIRIFWQALVSVVLILLGGWTIHANWPLRSIRMNDLEYSKQAAKRLNRYSEAQYAYGTRAWMDQQPEVATGYFHQAVTQNILFVDAWLRLAESQAELGQDANARAILTFVAQMTDQVLRWKWPQMVLASQLGMNDRFYRNANDLLTRRTLEQDTLQLLHTHLDGDTSAVLEILEPQNMTAYLEWLMRWGMAEDSLVAWQAMAENRPPDENFALRYAHFLLSHKRIRQSVEIWRRYTGGDGLTNPGFENDITGQGFDWRFLPDKEGNWELKRVYSESTEGDYAIRLKFNGKANIVFQHLYQILAVPPNTAYRLTYAWKAQGITTDQGPFVEIVGYDTSDIHETGTMMIGTHGWHDDIIDFTVPENCHAVVVRLRRKTSMRFDSKIRGRIWLDNFRLEAVNAD